jgi:hypothetical protein
MQAHKAAATATLMDSEGKVGRAYGARTTPHLYIVDPAGTLVYAGAIDSKPRANPADIRRHQPRQAGAGRQPGRQAGQHAPPGPTAARSSTRRVDPERHHGSGQRVLRGQRLERLAASMSWPSSSARMAATASAWRAGLGRVQEQQAAAPRQHVFHVRAIS